MAGEDDGVSVLGVDLGSVLGDLEKFQSGLDEVSDSMLKLSGATVQYNQEGEVTGFTFKQILADGRQLATTFKNVAETLEDGTKILGQEFAVAAQSINKITDAVTRLNREAVKGNLKKNLAVSVDKATPKELDAFNNAVARVAQNVGKNGFDIPQIENIYARVIAGADDFTVAEQKVVSEINRVIVASDKLGATFTKQQQAARAAAQAKLDAVSKEFQRKPNSRNPVDKVLDSVDSSGARAEKRRVDAVAKDIDTQEAAYNRLLAAQKQFSERSAALAASRRAKEEAAASAESDRAIAAKSREIDALEAADKRQVAAEKAALIELAQAKARASFQRADEFAKQNSAAVRKSQINSAVDVTRDVVTNQFANQIAGANPQQLNAFNNALQRAIQLVASGKVSVAEFSRILGNVKAGTIVTEVNPAYAALQSRLQATAAAFEVTTVASNRAQAAAARAAAEQRRLQEGIIANFTAGANRRANTRNQQSAADASQVISSTFGRAIGTANDKQLLAYNAALTQTLELLAKGKVSFAEFNRLFTQVRAGNITGGLTGSIGQLQDSLVRLQGAFKVTGDIGESAGKKIFLSFGNIVRIFESQILYAVFNKIQSGFGDATQAAADYSKQVGLIQTISQDADVSTVAWTQGLRGLSDQLGLPIADTAGAAYEALSNQVAKGADAFQFLATAGEFARTTNSTLTDSVNLISSAMNSFGLSASEADRIAKSFFVTIDLGRVKTPELANSFGRVATQADDLGVKLEELNAGISLLTRKGIKPNEAYTLLGNVFQKLIKPTEALQNAIESLGYASADAGIAGEGGLVPFLLKLKNSAVDSRGAVNEFFNEIRGRRGFSGLTHNEGKDFFQDLAAQQSDVGQYDKAKQIVEQTFGQQFEVQLNKIKNFFTVDVGGVFLENVIKLSNAVGGLGKAFITATTVATKLVAVLAFAYAVVQVRGLVLALGQASIALGFVRTAYFAAAGAGELFTAVSLSAGAAFAVATAGISVVVAAIASYFLLTGNLYDKSAADLRELTAKYQEESQKTIDIEQSAADKRSKAFESGIANAEKTLVKFSSTVRAQLQKSFDSINETGSKISDKVKAQLDLVSGTLRSQIQELESKLKSITSRQQSNIHTGSELIAGLADKRAERNLAINDANVANGHPDEGISIQEGRLRNLKRVASAAAIDTKNPERLEKILTDIDRISDDIFQRQIKIGHLDPSQAASNLTSIEQFKLRLYEQQNAALERQKSLIAQQVEKSKLLFEQFQEAEKKVTTFSVFDKSGDLKERYKGQGGSQRAIEDLGKAQDAVLELLNKIGANTDTKIHTAIESAKQVAELKKLFGDQKGNIGEQVAVKGKIAQDADDAERLREALKDVIRLQQELKNQQLDRIKDQQAKLVDSQTLTASIKTNIDNNTINGRPLSILTNPIARGISNASQENVADEAANLNKQLQNKQLTTEAGSLQAAIQTAKKLVERIDIADNKSGYENTSDSFANSKIGQDKNGSDITVRSAAVKTLENLQELQKNSNAGLLIASGLDSAQTKLDLLNTKAKEIDPTFKAFAASAKEAGAGISAGLDPALEKVKELQDAYNRIIDSLNAIQKLKDTVTATPAAVPSAPASGKVQTKSEGGLVGYYASGGFVSDFLTGKFAQGTDTVPVMATPGEYIVDAANTRQFLPILRSMSEGTYKPSPSGVTTTTNVGDIHITVQGGQTSQKTIKEIGSGLRRGIRQGTISLQS